ncbi:UDP-N-acetylmuramoyl-L-alanine--D-glutamate ligase [Breznakiella homolactica]|uniref:UDP-N-acetylmuramoylalanine--D-glutamate ligase n=1 Tax=Breznakiella homolactica TaxID=2798577 RepID=A0A7T8BCP8_9SPIR|nr:UDP-N-acetylmuramoyl-L-alanine--D-glutamate ligase [Breznakiella homolactica]QQO11345.1 UDP-N-acetylmuramoyl-L-alanine--D-glutamate ligase [Breznakiella homolactica]
MGLGLHGGGLESARYLAERGAEVTVTDLRDETVLAPSIEKLSALPIRYVLGRHETDDFKRADMVVKNPGVRPDSPYLQAARRVETDISIFLADSPARLTAVTGSKGKSSTASAIHWAMAEAYKNNTVPGNPKAHLGGNITVSPLVFLDSLREEDDVVLELSSWQLGDLAGRLKPGSPGEALLKPRAAVITAIMPDHLDRYGTMDAYVADKKIIYRGQDGRDCTVAGDDSWGKEFLSETKARPLVYSGSPLPGGVSGGWLSGENGPGYVRFPGKAAAEAVPPELLTPGYHQKKNLLAAAVALGDLGFEPDTIRDALGRFPGIPHRLEFFLEAGGVRFYNDSAATIPEAAAAAVYAFEKPPILVTGGTDKNLDFTPLANAAASAGDVILLAGTGSEKLMGLLRRDNTPFRGPFDSAEGAAKAALDRAEKGDTVVFSPGCTSFGMFLNEFDRGNRWKEAVRRLAGA